MKNLEVLKDPDKMTVKQMKMMKRSPFRRVLLRQKTQVPRMRKIPLVTENLEAL